MTEEIPSNNNPTSENDTSTKMPWKIYISRALSAWGNRMKFFGYGIFYVALAPENLRLVSIYGFVMSISAILCGASIGNWIDKSNRLTAAKLFLAVENLVTSLNCVVLGLYFAKESQELWIQQAVPFVSISLAAIAQLAYVGSEVLFEKDWIVVISS